MNSIIVVGADFHFSFAIEAYKNILISHTRNWKKSRYQEPRNEKPRSLGEQWLLGGMTKQGPACELIRKFPLSIDCDRSDLKRFPKEPVIKTRCLSVVVLRGILLGLCGHSWLKKRKKIWWPHRPDPGKIKGRNLSPFRPGGEGRGQKWGWPGIKNSTGKISSWAYFTAFFFFARMPRR